MMMSLIMLQQYLPFTVLKQFLIVFTFQLILRLQQYLPFTVLKHQSIILSGTDFNVATVLTVYGIET